MLKHKNEIEKLTLRQKTALLTQFDRLSDSGINSAGIPRVKRAELDDLVRESEYPAYSSIINCWDSALIEQMTTELALRAREAGYNFLVTPDLKAVSNPYKEGLSEDAFLNGRGGLLSGGTVPRGRGRGVPGYGTGSIRGLFPV